MIVAIGCKYNIISSQLYKSQFRHCELNQTRRRSTAYGHKEPLNSNGYFNATIKASDKTINTKVYVIEGIVLFRDSLLPRPENGPGTQAGKERVLYEGANGVNS